MRGGNLIFRIFSEIKDIKPEAVSASDCQKKWLRMGIEPMPVTNNDYSDAKSWLAFKAEKVLDHSAT